MNGRVFFRDPTMFESNNTQHSFGPKRQLTFRFRVVDVVSSVVRVVLPAVYIVVLVLSFVFFGVPCGVHRLQKTLVVSSRPGVVASHRLWCLGCSRCRRCLLLLTLQTMSATLTSVSAVIVVVTAVVVGVFFLFCTKVLIGGVAVTWRRNVFDFVLSELA